MTVAARYLEAPLKRLARQYPVVTLTGPRQSGKTTLVKKVFSNKPYVSMEDPDAWQLAMEDPRAFLAEYPQGAIIDEAQRAPLLFSYIQRIVDEKKKEGLFILTGSQNFELLEKITQSLAGRTAVTHLLPFSLSEAYPQKKPALDKMLYTGFYPRIFDKRLNPSEAMAFYVNTYIERDVRKMINIKDLGQFQTFLKLCAGRTGQELNLSALAGDCGLSHNTVRSWLSILEASFIITLIKPHYRNFNKRQTKAPKLHFLDSGLVCYLLGIENQKQISHHPLKGAVFESWAVSEFLKQRLHQVKASHLYYFRENNGHEIDMLLDYGQEVEAVEIKSAQTYSETFFKNIHFYRKLNSNCRRGIVIYGGDRSMKVKENNIISFQSIGNFLS